MTRDESLVIFLLFAFLLSLNPLPILFCLKEIKIILRFIYRDGGEGLIIDRNLEIG
jgi:hypothetical protein